LESETVRSFWEQFALNAAGPVVTALLGGLIVGVFASWITLRAQQRREDHQLRNALIDQVTEAASTFYFALQLYERAHAGATGDEHKKSLREALDDQYGKSRIEGAVLERRLAAYFDDPEPRGLWHAILDVLTVRYFQLIGQESDKLFTSNSGPEHSRLKASALKDWSGIARQHQLNLLDELSTAVLRRALRRSGA
jgi:hypothetical protein